MRCLRRYGCDEILPTHLVNGRNFATASTDYSTRTAGSADPDDIFVADATLTNTGHFPISSTINQLSGPAGSPLETSRWPPWMCIEIGVQSPGDLDQMLNEFSQGGTNYRLSLDVTTRFADGTPNPNFGRPFRLCATGQSRPRETAYDFDFKRVFFGRALYLQDARHADRKLSIAGQPRADLQQQPMVDMEYFNIFQGRNAARRARRIRAPRTEARAIGWRVYGPNLRRRAGSAKPRHSVIAAAGRPGANGHLRSLSLYYYPARRHHRGAAVLRRFGVHQPDGWKAAGRATRFEDLQ